VTQVYRLDIIREPCNGDAWICRHDQSTRLPAASVGEPLSLQVFR
jgi:hypothetical protein